MDIAPEFARQIGDGSEDPVRNYLTLDAGEPDLHLIQPRRVGRSEVKMNVRMVSEKPFDELGFVS